MTSDLDQLQFIAETHRNAEHQRRNYNGDDEDDDDDDEEEVPSHRESSDSDSDAPTSTDSEAPYGSDSESSSSYDEYYAERKLPKKKIHVHNKGPIKLYFQERIGNWPKYRYKKYKRSYMKRHGISITYGNVHTKEIKHSLKGLKRERTREGSELNNVSNMMETVAKQTGYLSLDAEHPIVPVGGYRATTPPGKSALKKMKDKLKKPFKHKEKASNTDNEQAAPSTDGEEKHKSSHSLEKI